MTLSVIWGNDLEAMAERLFRDMFAHDGIADLSSALQARTCVLVPNRIQQAWLRQYFLFTFRHRHRPGVLANCDFHIIHSFAGEWLGRMADPGGTPGKYNPEAYAFSVKSMRWRIYRILMSGDLDGTFEALARYVRPDGRPNPGKGFKLSGRLAKLLDEYLLYRPEMMQGWERGKGDDLEPSLRWQPALWRRLIAEQGGRTPLDVFNGMGSRLKQSGLPGNYRKLFLFAPSMMPRVYLHFIKCLADLLPVACFFLNPAQGDWCDQEDLKRRLQIPADEMPDDAAGLLFQGQHPLLSAYARGARDLVATAIDLTGGQVDDVFKPAPGDDVSVLDRLIESVGSENADAPGHRFSGPNGEALSEGIEQTGIEPPPSPRPHRSEARPGPPERASSAFPIQIHLCHGKMREVEVLRDLLLRCFEDFPGLQPRDVQVQVTDMTAYAPYIDAVFSTPHGNAADTIPYVIADRVVAGESPAAEAFRQLLHISDSRFTAPEVLALLRCECVAARFSLDDSDVDSISAWLDQAAVRWGRDREHRKAVSGAEFEDPTTWQHGLDRLLLGYAIGRDPALPGYRADLAPCDCVEGGDAVTLGRLVVFYEKLCAIAEAFGREYPAGDWPGHLEKLIEDFFVSDNDTFLDIGILRNAVRLLRTTFEVAGFHDPLPLAVIREFLLGHLGEVAAASDATRNAVVVNSLRAGSSAPRRVMCLLGMGDGLYPRAENRPAFDLMRLSRKMGDRNATIEDRMAFLEAILNTRERLIISYPAFSEEDNSRSGESVVVRELTGFLTKRFGAQSFPVIEHKLHAFDPAYFQGGGDLFSYSAGNGEASRAWVKAQGVTDPPRKPMAGSPGANPAVEVTLDQLAAFFQNPVNYYYRHVLGVIPEPRLEGGLADAEVVEASHLEAYAARHRLVEALLADETVSSDALYPRLASEGLIPLGQWGKKWLAGEHGKMKELLHSRWPDVGMLSDALKKNLAAHRKECRAAVKAGEHNILVTGVVPVIQADGIDVHLSFACSSPKAKRQLGAWLAHVLAAASGNPVTTVDIQGKSLERGAVEGWRFAPNVDQADKLLADYVRLFLAGHHDIPSYTPETAAAYVDVIKKPPKNKEAPPDDAEVTRKALDAARKKWTSGPRNKAYDGDQDPSYRKAFGPDGPFAGEGKKPFSDLAVRIMGPMFEARAKLDPLDTPARSGAAVAGENDDA